MFGQNEVVGRKFFEGEDKLLVTSVFHTLQGEGPFVGRPAVFVRLSKCSLRCNFCDTYFDHGDWMTTGDLYNAWHKAVYPNDPSAGHSLLDKILVITGGEPTLQPALSDLVRLGLMYFDKVQIETNGLLSVDLPRNVYLVVSPKCTEGGDAHYLKPPERVLERANCLKFVISHDHTSSYHKVPSWAFEWRDKTKRPIYVSPMNVYTHKPYRGANDIESRSRDERVSFWEPGLLNLDHVRANHEYAAQYCLDHNLYLSIQMQLFAAVP